MKIAINGAGVAGPALAYWLLHYGHEPVLIERAPALRTGGYVIDFWGAGYDIAERMGILPRLLDLGYQVEEVRFVDANCRRSGGFSTDVFSRMTGGRFTSLQRSDLASTIYAAIEGKVETLFGDGIVSIEEEAGGVHVGFGHAAPRDFDLVIGADGLHSRVRSLTFGEEAGFERFLGYNVAAFELTGYRPRDELVYVSHALAGRQVSRFSKRGGRTLFMFCYREKEPAPAPEDDAGRREALRREFAGMKWEVPAILEAMDGVENIYFDRVSQIEMPRWTKGRVALIGDAAACVSLLAGEGCGLAMTEAYVLAGEIGHAGSDHATAFSRYEERMRPFLADKQAAARKFASSFVPETDFGIAFRNWMMRLMVIPPVANFLVGELNDTIDLPDYEAA
ncbi:MAG: FAD-binding domain [Hyphomicrobiales bacterium]|nr:FAD-binding domain [Hyphomicrobiales bacterium]